MSRKHLDISQEKFLDRYISSLRKKKAESLERFCFNSVMRPENPVDNCFKFVSFLMMKQVVNELNDYEFKGEVKIEESKNEEEIPTMVIDNDQDSIDEKTEAKMKNVSKPLISHEISDGEELETISV